MDKREYLFKAKTIPTENFKFSKWVYGTFHKINNRYFMVGFLDVDAFSLSSDERDVKEVFLRVYEIDPDTICQFTNLIDKNNVRIFENDIVRFYGYFHSKYYEDAVISFENGAFVGKGKVRSYDSEFTMYLYPYIIKGEVLRNIHD